MPTGFIGTAARIMKRAVKRQPGRMTNVRQTAGTPRKPLERIQSENLPDESGLQTASAPPIMANDTAGDPQSAEWQERMRELCERVRNRVPAGVSEAQIDADVRSAVAEVRRRRRARGD